MDKMDKIDKIDKMYRGSKFLVSLGPEERGERGEEKVEVHESSHNRQLQRSTTTWNPKVQLWINTQTQAAQAALGRIRIAPAETQRVSSLPPVFPFPGHEPSRSLCQRYQGLLSTQTRTFTTVFSPSSCFAPNTEYQRATDHPDPGGWTPSGVLIGMDSGKALTSILICAYPQLIPSHRDSDSRGRTVPNTAPPALIRAKGVVYGCLCVRTTHHTPDPGTRTAWPCGSL
jgi:hypothetical protein